MTDLKKNHLTRMSEDLEFAKMINDRIAGLMDRRQSDVEEEFVCSSTPDFFDTVPHLLDNDSEIEPKYLGETIERGKTAQSNTELSEIGRKSDGRY